MWSFLIFCVKFCDSVPSYSNFFSAVGSNLTFIYELLPTSDVELFLGIEDADSEDILYSCAWGSNNVGDPVILSGGKSGIVKCTNIKTRQLISVLVGHGGAVNDIRVHPIDNNLCISASRDESIRLWNILSSVCVAIFSGDGGHRLDVLALDFHMFGNCFLSAGKYDNPL